MAVTLAVKPYAVLFVPWIFWRRQLRSAMALVIAGAAIMLLPTIVYGVGGTLTLYRSWWAVVTGSTPANLLNPDNVSFASLYAKWLGTGGLATTLALVTSVSALGVIVWLVFARRAASFPEALEGSVLLLLVPLLSPQGWDYVLLLAAPGVVLLANYNDLLPTPLRVAGIAAALVMGLSLFDVMGRSLYAAFMNMAAITACAIVLLSLLCVLRARRIA